MLPFYRPLASCSNASNIRKLQTIKRLWLMEVYGIRGKAQLPIISLYGIGGENWLKRQHKDQFEFLSFTQVGRFPISHFQLSPLRGNKNWPLLYKSGKVGKFGEQNWLTGLHMVLLECPRQQIHSGWENSPIPFSAFSSLG